MCCKISPKDVMFNKLKAKSLLHCLLGKLVWVCRLIVWCFAIEIINIGCSNPDTLGESDTLWLLSFWLSVVQGTTLTVRVNALGSWILQLKTCSANSYISLIMRHHISCSYTVFSHMPCRWWASLSDLVRNWVVSGGGEEMWRFEVQDLPLLLNYLL